MLKMRGLADEAYNDHAGKDLEIKCVVIATKLCILYCMLTWNCRTNMHSWYSVCCVLKIYSKEMSPTKRRATAERSPGPLGWKRRYTLDCGRLGGRDLRLHQVADTIMLHCCLTSQLPPHELGFVGTRGVSCVIVRGSA